MVLIGMLAGIGVLIGIDLSAAKLLLSFSRLDGWPWTRRNSPRAMLSLMGAATFLRLPRLAAALDEVPSNAELHFDIERLDTIDLACFDLLMNWTKQHETTVGLLIAVRQLSRPAESSLALHRLTSK